MQYEDGEYLTIQEAAKLKGCSISALYGQIYRSKNSPLVFRREGKKWLVSQKSMEQWVLPPYKHLRPENARGT